MLCSLPLSLSNLHEELAIVVVLRAHRALALVERHEAPASHLLIRLKPALFACIRDDFCEGLG